MEPILLGEVRLDPLDVVVPILLLTLDVVSELFVNMLQML